MNDTTIMSRKIETPYVSEPDHRFVVSLVFGMPDDDATPTPTHALAAALSGLALCGHHDDRVWCVHDSKTDERLLIRAGDAVASPSPPSQVVLHAEIDAAGSVGPTYADSAGPLDDIAKEELIAVLQDLPWGDVQGQLSVLDHALRLGLQATGQDFLLWESKAQEELGVDDEFSLKPDDIQMLSEEWILAYVARLLRTVALMYGIRTEFSPGLLGARQLDGPGSGAIVRRLNDIVERSTARRQAQP